MDILYIFSLSVAILFSPLFILVIRLVWDEFIPFSVKKLAKALTSIIFFTASAYVINEKGLDLVEEFLVRGVALFSAGYYFVKGCKVESTAEQQRRFAVASLESAGEGDIEAVNDHFAGGVSHSLSREIKTWRPSLYEALEKLGGSMVLDVLGDGSPGSGQRKMVEFFLRGMSDEKIVEELVWERNKLLGDIIDFGNGVGVVKSDKPLQHGVAFATSGSALKVLLIISDGGFRVSMRAPQGGFSKKDLKEIGDKVKTLSRSWGCEGPRRWGLFINETGVKPPKIADLKKLT